MNFLNTHLYNYGLSGLLSVNLFHGLVLLTPCLDGRLILFLDSLVIYLLDSLLGLFNLFLVDGLLECGLLGTDSLQENLNIDSLLGHLLLVNSGLFLGLLQCLNLLGTDLGFLLDCLLSESTGGNQDRLLLTELHGSLNLWNSLVCPAGNLCLFLLDTGKDSLSCSLPFLVKVVHRSLPLFSLSNSLLVLSNLNSSSLHDGKVLVVLIVFEQLMFVTVRRHPGHRCDQVLQIAVIIIILVFVFIFSQFFAWIVPVFVRLVVSLG